MSKFGLFLVLVYFLLIAKPIWNVLSGHVGGGFFGSNFGLFMVTLPGSLAAEFFKNLVDSGNLLLRARVEIAVYMISALINLGVVYFWGWGLGKIYQQLVK